MVFFCFLLLGFPVFCWSVLLYNNHGQTCRWWFLVLTLCFPLLCNFECYRSVFVHGFFYRIATDAVCGIIVMPSDEAYAVYIFKVIGNRCVDMYRAALYVRYHFYRIFIAIVFSTGYVFVSDLYQIIVFVFLANPRASP